MKIRNQRDFWSGVLFIACGLFFAVGARNYTMGTAQKMGPAYFPIVLGGVLAVLGCIITLTSLRGAAATIDRINLGAVAWIAGAVVAFGVLLIPAGLIVALIAVVVISMLGSHEFKWYEAVVVSGVMAVIVWTVFIYGLKLTIPVWPAFVGG
jgi:hypothetical protein